MLAYGEKSEMVLASQQRLFDLGYMTSRPDGTYGADTSLAVKAFQSRNGLSSDGSAGAQTLARPTSEDAKKTAVSGGSNKGNSKEQTALVKKSEKNAVNAGNSSKEAAPAYSGDGSVDTLLLVASSKMGSPYVWGAKGRDSFDCSGFVYWCLNNAGAKQSYLTSSGWRSVGKYMRIDNFSDLRAGDIIVENGHVGICAGGGEVIDASSSNGRVVSRSLSSWWQNNFIVGWRVF